MRWLLGVMAASVVACGAGAQQQQRPTAGLMVHLAETPVELSGPIGLDRAIELAIARHPLTDEQGHAPAADVRAEHEAEMRYRAERAYADYVRAADFKAIADDASARIERIAQVVHARTGAASVAPEVSYRAVLARAHVEVLQLHADDAFARAGAELNAALGRPLDAPLGPPADRVPMSVSSTLEELTARALHNHPVHGAHEEAHLRGEVSTAYARLQRHQRIWAAAGAEAESASEQSVAAAEAAYQAGRLDVIGLLDLLRNDREADLDRVELAAEIGTAVADLEHVVGEPLSRVAIAAPPAPPASATASTAAPAAGVNAPAAPEPANAAPAAPAAPAEGHAPEAPAAGHSAHPAHPAHPAPHGAAPHAAAPHGAATHDAAAPAAAH